MSGVGDDEIRAATEAAVRDHVTGILFDGSEAADPACVLCQRGVEFGIWAEFGYPDPFSEDDDD